MFEDRTSKVALVIGGTGALGKDVCRLLAEEGADIAFTYRSSTGPAEALADEIRAAGRKALTAAVAIEKVAEVNAFVERVIAELGRIDMLVYASGPTIDLTPISRVEPAEWARVTDNDINGCFNVVKAVLPHLRASRGSFTAILTAVVDRPSPLDVLSTAPKAAIQALVRTIAAEEGRNGIRANCVAPGFIDAGLGAKLMSELKPEQSQAIIGKTPLRRLGSVRELADAVGYLSSARASFVTGVTICVSGGLEL